MESPAESRASYLETLCGDDAELLAEVERMVEAAEHRTHVGLLDAPAWQQMAPLLSESPRQIEKRLAAGTQLGPYRIVELLGAGGMGEVYRARDTRLGREVAIKVLGSPFPAKTDGYARLLQEARAVSALNHPNILALHDICSEKGTEFLVMELVRGKTLGQMIGNRGMAVNKAVKYAIPIADALARAHMAGILHRDLKPSNIMITEEGVPKVLDFGLARAAESENRNDGQETRSEGRGSEQVVAGTAAYMSPEQAEGKKLDARSDIFSFGAVLYEMVTGRRAFHGDSTASTLAAVLGREPEPPTRFAPQMPRELERIIQRCLRKDPNRRFHSMHDVKVELEEVREESDSGIEPAQAPARKYRRMRIYATVAAVVVLTAASAAWWLYRPPLPPPSAPVPLTAYEGNQSSPDFSPDGSQVAFAYGEQQGKSHIYVKPIGSTNHLQLTKGNADDDYPRWSPDGRWIAFQREDNAGAHGAHTFLMSPIGGSERKLHDGACSGLSWSSDSKALACGSWPYFGPLMSATNGLILISPEGGETRQLTNPPKGEFDMSPAFSPDGRKLLFVRGRAWTDCDVYLLTLNADLSPQDLRRITNEHGMQQELVALAWTANGQEAIWAVSKKNIFRSTFGC